MEYTSIERALLFAYAETLPFGPIVGIHTVKEAKFCFPELDIRDSDYIASNTYFRFSDRKLVVYETMPGCTSIFSSLHKMYESAIEWKEGTGMGLKYDGDKPRMDLLPFDALLEVSKNLSYGAKKYKPNSWQNVPDAESRYQAALLRHLAAVKCGERIDPESGMTHYACIATNALFLCSLDCMKHKATESKSE